MLEEIGCLALVLEEIPASSLSWPKSISIPAIRIGAASGVDGQVIGASTQYIPPGTTRLLAQVCAAMPTLPLCDRRRHHLLHLGCEKRLNFPNENEQH